MIDCNRLYLANQVLATYEPAIGLFVKNDRLWMQWDTRTDNPRCQFPATLRSDGLHPKYGYSQRPTGGTGMASLTQIIRYVRDLPRFPLSQWEYWAGEKVMLCSRETIDLLVKAGYNDPHKTHCVLCGRNDWRRGLDWWSMGNVVGPACSFGKCVAYPSTQARVADYVEESPVKETQVT